MELDPKERARATARIYMHAKTELTRRHKEEFKEILAEMYVKHGDPRIKQGKQSEIAALKAEVARLKELVGE